MSILNEIISQKKVRLVEAKANAPLPEVRQRAEAMDDARDFAAAISRGEGEGLRLIAELKKASPSKGLIRPDFDPAEIADIYASHADAMSVLTEEDHFQGALGYISVAKSASPLPALRKDFIIEDYQVFEARAAGADAILLIAKIMDQSLAGDLMALAHELGMGVLFEVHEFEEMDMALELDSTIIGVNNRDLSNLEVDLGHTIEIMREVPLGVTVVSESGISTHDDVRRLEDAGVDAMLVGTALMLADDIAGAIMRLRGRA